MVGSVEARIERILRRRPEFERLERLTAVPWLAGTGSFRDCGAYDQVVRRCYELGHGDLERDCRRALADLQRAEQQVKLAFVRGDGCRTLYQRQPRRRAGSEGA
jgi:hypothetical protein